MDIKLIALDLDGTALQPDHITITPRLQAALQKAHEKGIRIAPVTGRPFKLLPPLLNTSLPWKEYGILCNGGQIRNLVTGQILYSLVMQEPDLLGLVSLSERFGIPIEFSADSRLYLTRASLEAQQKISGLSFHCNKILSQNGVVVDSLLPLCTDSRRAVEKVNLNGIPGDLHSQVEEALKGLEVSAVWSSSSNMEITHKYATKGGALRRLCQMLEIPLEQVMALGDSGNDLTMLKAAGLGVAMGSAPEALKQAADAVTKTNAEDGAALAIETYAL